MKLIFELIGALPALIALFNRVASYVDAAEQRGVGRKEAVNEALIIQTEQLRVAQEVRDAAHRKHVTDPTDDAFDKDFQRPS